MSALWGQAARATHRISLKLAQKVSPKEILQLGERSLAVMIDANIFLSFLIPSDMLEDAKRIIRLVYDAVTILDVLEEVAYVDLSLNHGSKGFKLKGEVIKRALARWTSYS